jgi:hypothetical protein
MAEASEVLCSRDIRHQGRPAFDEEVSITGANFKDASWRERPLLILNRECCRQLFENVFELGTSCQSGRLFFVEHSWWEVDWERHQNFLELRLTLDVQHLPLSTFHQHEEQKFSVLATANNMISWDIRPG